MCKTSHHPKSPLLSFSLVLTLKPLTSTPNTPIFPSGLGPAGSKKVSKPYPYLQKRQLVRKMRCRLPSKAST